MKEMEYKFYKTISRASQDDLLAWTESYLTDTFTEERVIATEDFVYAIGDIPVMLVAHLDTVHTMAPSDMYYDKEKQVIWSPQGLGADDRAGIYAILRILMADFRPHVLFTTDEEVGGIGAKVAAEALKPDLNFIIELDRRGKEDSVFYDCDNPDFEKYINKFGFVTNFGSFSDISTLCPEWKVAGVNLSIGYENEHTKSEILHVDYMQNTIEKVKKILETVNAEKDKFEYIEAFGLNGYDHFLGSWKSYEHSVAYGYSTSKYDKAISNYVPSDEICYECFGGFAEELTVRVGHEVYCGDCYAKIYTTCTECGEQFKDRSRTHILCEKCRKDK